MRSGASLLLILLAATLIPVSGAAYQTSTWVSGGDPASLRSLQLHASELDEVNPLLYRAREDGGLEATSSLDENAFRAAAVGSRIIPTVVADRRVASAILASSGLRASHAAMIASLVRERVWDGIEIDYDVASGEELVLFLTELKRELALSGRNLVVALQPKAADDAGVDWRAVSLLADRVKIKMWRPTAEPAQLAPLDWITAVSRYASSTIPPSKIVFAFPWEGTDWSPLGASVMTFEEAREVLISNRMIPHRHRDGELTFTYKAGDGTEHVVWFQDVESFRRKVETALKETPGAAGVAQWKSGGEDDRNWIIVSQLHAGRRRPVAPSTPAPPTATMAVQPEPLPIAESTQNWTAFLLFLFAAVVAGLLGQVAARRTTPRIPVPVRGSVTQRESRGRRP
jgi:hypothetical protein